MKLSEALGVVNGAREKARGRRFFLVCGFTPLHLKTFLAAHLQSAVADARVEIATGVYGDVAAALADVPGGSELAVVLEWPDLDPRLGFRRLGGWGPAHTADIVGSARAQLASLAEKIRAVADSSSVTLCLPSVPLPPFAAVPTWLLDADTLALTGAVNEFALDLARHPAVRVVDSSVASTTTGIRSFDFKAELQSGFPYTTAHADSLAAAIAMALLRRQPKKGLITDLDDTLWSGLLGEVGLDGVSWTLDRDSQIHGIYQQLLNAFASGGTLLAVASKNDGTLVEKALGQLDLVVDKTNLYPVEASWGPKSQGIRRILDRWNIGASDVVFIDDSPMELAEVKSAFPEMECILFKPADSSYSYDLFFRLQDLFGKSQVSTEDRLRLSSIKGQEQLRDERERVKSEDEFLEGLEAVLTIRFSRDFSESRPFELVNKTNQFNLNGNRFDAASWKQLSSDPQRCLIVVDYKDKYGPLGAIAVATGTRRHDLFDMDAWVMSCRAFSRRIEYATMAAIFSTLRVESIELRFCATARNGPIQAYLGNILGQEPAVNHRISKAGFYATCPPLSHSVNIHPDSVIEAE
jgi:FkbH-like protein